MDTAVVEQSRAAAQAAGMSLSGWLTVAARHERLRQWHSTSTELPAQRSEAVQQAEEVDNDRHWGTGGDRQQDAA
jgi:hypothetical protein